MAGLLTPFALLLYGLAVAVSLFACGLALLLVWVLWLLLLGLKERPPP